MLPSLALLLLLQAGAAGSPGVVFNAPANWIPIEAPPLKAFTAPGLAAGEMILFTVWPEERVASGTFDTWFEGKLHNPGETVLQQTAVERRPLNGLDVLMVTQRISVPGRGQTVRLVYAIASGPRVALAMVTGNRDQLITRYAAEARDFLESLHFSEEAAAVVTPPDHPAAPPDTPAGIRAAIPPAGFNGTQPRGLFYRLLTGLGGSRMETGTRLFLPSGRLIMTPPSGGGDVIDLGRCNADMCGTYRIDGAWLTVRWDNGETRRLSYARSGETFTMDGDTWRPARGLDRAEAVGTWVDPAGGAAPVDAGLRLSADGTFTWGTGGRAGTLRGRYDLRGLTLTLHFTDGTTRDYAFFAAGRSRPAGLVSIDGSVYVRR
ncbi:MAG: hypothetical protein AB7I33_09425 [Gemmatimonadales bacterium]